MSPLQDLTRDLLTAGSTSDAESNVDYLLFVDPEESFLQCQHWSSDSLVQEELVTSSVRPNSTAAYLITPTGRFIICITPSSKLSAYTFDVDDDEWVESAGSPVTRYDVHPDGKLDTLTDASGRVYLFFQDPSKHLICLDDAWAFTIIPAVNPAAGTPISTLVTEDAVYVYYISANDNFIHVVARDSHEAWTDSIVVNYALTEQIEAISVGENEWYVLTRAHVLLKITAESEALTLGTVKDGKCVPVNTEEAGFSFKWFRKGRPFFKFSFKW